MWIYDYFNLNEKYPTLGGTVLSFYLHNFDCKMFPLTLASEEAGYFGRSGICTLSNDSLFFHWQVASLISREEKLVVDSILLCQRVCIL